MGLIQDAVRRMEAQAAAAATAAAAPPAKAAAAVAASAASPADGAHAAPAAVPARVARVERLDLDHLRANGFLVAGHQQLELSEQMRVIKRPLIAQALGDESDGRRRLIMVASALPGEGKTFFAANLALSLAMEIDGNVLLVDADVVRPSLGRTLRLSEGAAGLMDVLAGSADLADAIVRTNVPKLSVLPAGAPRADSTELLASAAMARLLDELSSRYPDRIVVFDTPPLLGTTQSRVLASLVGQVVMVVDSSSTHQGTAAHAFATVEQCPHVVAVLNKCHPRQTHHRFGYYEA